MLFRIEGKISEIIPKGEFFASIIVKKRVRGMISPIVFDLRGEPFRKIVKTKEIQEGDKVRIWFVPVCRKYNDRYYTNLTIEKIELLITANQNLFSNHNGDIIDTETGEVFYEQP
jgi:hypothetical protein